MNIVRSSIVREGRLTEETELSTDKGQREVLTGWADFDNTPPSTVPDKEVRVEMAFCLRETC